MWDFAAEPNQRILFYVIITAKNVKINVLFQMGVFLVASLRQLQFSTI